MQRRVSIVLSVLCILLVVPCAHGQSATGSTPAPAEQLSQLFEQYQTWQYSEFPEWAMDAGDYSEAHRIADVSLDAIGQRHRMTMRFLDQLHTFDPNVLDEQDRVSYELFDRLLSEAIEGHRYRDFLMPVGGRFGHQQEIPQMADRVRFRSQKDYEDYLSRLSMVPERIDQLIKRMQRGVTEGRTPPAVTLAGVPAQFDALVNGGALNVLRTPLTKFPAHIDTAAQAKLVEQFDTDIFPHVHAAMDRFGRYFTDTYLPACRASIAAVDLPEGEAFYAFQLRHFTTTDMTAEAIHQTGLAEVARLRLEMLEVIRRSDFLELHPDLRGVEDDALFEAFLNYLRTDPRFYHETEDALLAEYRDICKRVDGFMPEYFGRLPRLPYGVKPMPRFMAASQTTAFYQPGDLRNAQAGFFVANTYRLDQRPKYEMIPLAMHEAVPGHHLQIALAQELEDLPEFRRNAYFVAFGEGWALYSERLGIEMGLYSDPYDDFGRLLYEMWRACRLVVDPGMHALGWTREQSIEFMLANTALSRLNIETEVDRYIAWPGQACGYKIGELRIRALRERAESRLGDRFDRRAFHDVVLGAGSIPLTILERRVNDWIDEQTRVSTD